MTARKRARVSVELCHGTWCTFARAFAHQTDSVWRQHASRDAARAFAVELLTPRY